MRGGERLVKKCSWMSGICFGLHHSTGKSETFRYRCPSSVFFDNRFRSADCQKIQLPLGGSQETHRRWLFVNYSSGQSSSLPAQHSIRSVPSHSGGKRPAMAMPMHYQRYPPFCLTPVSQGYFCAGGTNSPKMSFFSEKRSWIFVCQARTAAFQSFMGLLPSFQPAAL